jgi:hypothetical protein
MGWIRISEGMPKENVTVFVEYGEFIPVAVESTYDGAGEVVFNDKIVAWMEIPKELLEKV